MPEQQWRSDHRDRLDAVLSQFEDEPGPLIDILQGVQALFGYVPRQAVAQISRKLRVAQAQIFGVVTFYAQFSLHPKGRHTILCCQGTACHVRGAAGILDKIKNSLNVAEGHTTEDGRFTVERVYCVGCCSLAPAVIIDNTAFGRLTPGKLPDILSRYE